VIGVSGGIKRCAIGLLGSSDDDPIDQPKLRIAERPSGPTTGSQSDDVCITRSNWSVAGPGRNADDLVKRLSAFHIDVRPRSASCGLIVDCGWHRPCGGLEIDQDWLHDERRGTGFQDRAQQGRDLVKRHVRLGCRRTIVTAQGQKSSASGSVMSAPDAGQPGRNSQFGNRTGSADRPAHTLVAVVPSGLG
jgi:hypothetical protein